MVVAYHLFAMNEHSGRTTRLIWLLLLPLMTAALAAGGVPPVCAGDVARARTDTTGIDEPIPLEFYLESARTARQNGQWDIAEMEYQNVLIRESSNLAAIMELAEVYERMGKYEHARGLLSRASTLDRGNRNLIEQSARVDRKLRASLHAAVDSLMERKTFELALPKLALLITLEPENPDLYYRKSLCHYSLSRYDVALATIETALRLRNEVEYHDLHLRIINRMKQVEIHSLMQKAAAVINPRSETERQSALTLLAKVIELDPDNGWAKQEFLRLSENDPVPRAERSEEKTGFVGSISRAGGTALALLRDTGLLLSGHLDILLIMLALLLLFQSPLSRMLLRRSQYNAVLAGNLSRFGIAEILSLIHSHDYTGTLTIKGQTISGTIYFDHGEAYHCTVGRSTGREALRSLLNRAKSGRFFFKETGPPVERTIDVPLSLLIMDLPERSAAAQAQRPRKRAKSKITELLESRK